MISTAPAFQFYPKEFLSSTKVIAMSATERGAYITLLSMQWLDGSLPNDVPALAKLVGIRESAFLRMWPHNLARCFTERDGRLVNERLERQRKELKEYVARCQRGGERSAETRRTRYGSAQPPKSPRSNARSGLEVPPNTATATTTAEEQKISAESSNDSPPVLVFPTVGPSSSWGFSNAQLVEWQGLFTNVDVLLEARHALAWVQANAGKRKTAKGMPRFLVSWLTRVVDKGVTSRFEPLPARGAASMPTYTEWEGCPHVEEHDSKYRCQQATALGKPRKA